MLEDREVDLWGATGRGWVNMIKTHCKKIAKELIRY